MKAKEINSRINQLFRKDELDYSILDQHIRFLEKLSVVQNSFVSIFVILEANRTASTAQCVHGQRR